jgi:peptidoglycan/LPS O-acetylase OafA/YrhL
METSAKRKPLEHRPDIDGLRAVAVLAVLVYHLGLPMHGGFVGVDVFFVISGFLISSIILDRFSANTFSFAWFYERRARRILPALVVVLAATTALSYRYLFPVELEEYAHSLLAATFSGSNFYFWLKSGYFDSPSASQPLLHTWSLAVEEQFYFALPPFLWLVQTYAPKRLQLSVVCLAVASLALSIVGAYRYPTSTFYLAPSRAWELLLGTLVSLDGFPRLRRAFAREIAGLAGIVLILWSCTAYQTTTVFPGLAALPPCCGAALIIVAGRDGPNLVGRLLSLKPVTAVGLVSYSLYLWHWPVIVFSNLGMTFVHGLDRHQAQVVIALVSGAMAVLSWALVERPFRIGGFFKLSRAAVFRLSGAAVVVLAVSGVSLVTLHGVPGRFSPEAREMAGYLDPQRYDDQFRTGKCFMTARDWQLEKFDLGECMPSSPGKHAVLILGDSHAAHLWWGMNAVHPDWDVMQATAAGCKPVLTQAPRQFPGCTRLMTFVLEKYLPTHHVDAVMLEARWEPGDMKSLAETIEWLQGKHVPLVLLGPMLQYDSPLPRLLAMSMRDHDPDVPAQHRVVAMSGLDRTMSDSATHDWHTPYVSMIDLLCDHDRCAETVQPGVPLLSDYGHLTKEGSVMVAERLRDAGRVP